MTDPAPQSQPTGPSPSGPSEPSPAVTPDAIAGAFMEFDEALVQRLGDSEELVCMLAETHLKFGAAMLTELGATELQMLSMMREARRSRLDAKKGG
jgi:hypothetical protein